MLQAFNGPCTCTAAAKVALHDTASVDLRSVGCSAVKVPSNRPLEPWRLQAVVRGPSTSTAFENVLLEATYSEPEI